jgi:hypothetical protein
MMMLLMLLMILMMMIQIYGAAEGRTARPRGASASNPLLATAPLPRTPRGVEIAPEMARGTPAMAATSFIPMFLPATPIPTHYVTHCLSAARIGGSPPSPPHAQDTL